MTESFVRGTVAPLGALFREYAPNGPLVDVDDLTIKIVPLLGGDPALPQTDVGITHPATGTYGYGWAISPTLDDGRYVVIWAGFDIGTGDPVGASEEVDVTALPAPTPSGDGEGPCNWDIDTSCVPNWDDLSEAAQLVGYHLSTLTLWALTGRRYGQCEITVQPCMERQRWPLYETFPVPSYGGGGAGGYGGYFPYILDGQWFNRGCGSGCRCRARCEVSLDGPTTTAGVLSVYVHGELVDPSAYQIQNGYLLVRTDGQCWPGCVDYSKQDPAAFVVTYLRGDALPAGLQVAGGILAGEFAMSCDGDDRCRLPARLTSLTRQGVSVQVATINSYLDLGMTEIPEVDAIVVALNPYRQVERSRVYSPDRPRPRMVT